MTEIDIRCLIRLCKKLICSASYSTDCSIAVKHNPRRTERQNLLTSSTGTGKKNNISSLKFFPCLQYLPSFYAAGQNISVLNGPSEFYNCLLNLSNSSSKRIILASLYLGIGKQEQLLVNALSESLQRSCAERTNLRLKVLLDCIRGSRGVTNSRTMLVPLLKYGEKVRVSLYHTPDLRGWRKVLTPERYNETVGVSHLKVNIFDDTVVMTGANLSESYFTNRQDRYLVLRNCRSLADFFEELIDAVSSLSFHLTEDNTTCLSPGVTCHPYKDKDGGESYRHEMNRRVSRVIQSHVEQTAIDLSNNRKSRDDDVQHSELDSDTVIYPSLQMGPFNIRLDNIITRDLLETGDDDVRIFLASGYFNLTRQYMESLLNKSSAQFDIVMASPEANGFYGAQGLSAAIPDAYTYIARQFYREVWRCGASHRIRLHEYSRHGWTFHAKGLWYYVGDNKLPVMTLIGSPNFGYRSVYRDLEAQVAIVTENESLQNQLYEEQQRLYNRCTRVSDETFSRTDRQVPLWVKAVTPLIRNFF